MRTQYAKASFKLPSAQNGLFYPEDDRIVDGVQIWYGTSDGKIELHEKDYFNKVNGNKLWFPIRVANLDGLVEAEASVNVAPSMVSTVKNEILSDLQSAEQAIAEIHQFMVDYQTQNDPFSGHIPYISWEKSVGSNGSPLYKVMDGFYSYWGLQHPLGLLAQKDYADYEEDIIMAYNQFLNVFPKMARKKLHKLRDLARFGEERQINEAGKTIFSFYFIAPSLDEGVRKTILAYQDEDVLEFVKLYSIVR
jgi:hypothetical protein